MGFTKLDSGIINSSIWEEPFSTRVLWVAILAMCDENGLAHCSASGLRRAANMSQELFDAGILALSSPDADSRTPDNEGKRIEKIDGGYLVLNFMKYRDHSFVVREQTRNRVRRHREKSNVTLQSVTGALHSVSASASASVSLGSINSKHSGSGGKGEPQIKKPREHKNKHGQYGNVMLTATELDKLIADYGQDSATKAIEKVDLYIEEKGAKYKSHYLTILRWGIAATKQAQPCQNDKVRTWGRQTVTEEDLLAQMARNDLTGVFPDEGGKA